MKPIILIYIKPGCPYCAAAEKLFTSKGFEYKTLNYFDLSDDEREELSKKTDNWSSAPMIFINNKFYGGFDDVNALDEKGELDKILGGKKDE